MRYVRTASVAGLLLLCYGAFAQSPTLSIANYQFVSDQVITAAQSRVTYRVDLLNSGPALAHVTATVTRAMKQADSFQSLLGGSGR